MVKLFFYSINLYMKIEDLTNTQLKRLARYYNLHTKIPNISKSTREQLLENIKKYIGIDEEKPNIFYVIQHEFNLKNAISTKKQREKEKKER